MSDSKRSRCSSIDRTPDEMVSDGSTPKKARDENLTAEDKNMSDLNVSSNSVEGVIVERQLSSHNEEEGCPAQQDQNEHVISECDTPSQEDTINLEPGSSEGENVPWQYSTKSITARLNHVYEHPEFSDYTVLVGAENVKVFHVHKFMLCITSSKWKEMIYGNEGSELVLADVSPDQFEILRRFIYTGKLILTSVEEACNLYRISLKYEIPNVQNYTEAYSLKNLSCSNIWYLFELAVELDSEKLIVECSNFLSKNPLSWQSLSAVSRKLLMAVLSIESLDIAEIEILKALDKWAALHCGLKEIEITPENKRNAVEPELLSKIRFLAIPPSDFLAFSFDPECSDSDAPRSFLTAKETFAILANLNRAGCVKLPEWISSCNRSRGQQKYRVRRKTIFTFGLEVEYCALNYLTPTSSVGSKTFKSSITVDRTILLHGIQIPTFWIHPGFVMGQTCYQEHYKLEIKDRDNNCLAKAGMNVSVNYSSFVDIILAQAVILEAHEEYKIVLITDNVYYLIKKFRTEEVEENVKFTFYDSFIPFGNNKAISPIVNQFVQTMDL